VDVSAIQQMWPNIIEAVKHKSKVAWMAIMSGVQPVSLEHNLLTLSFEVEGARTNFNTGGRDVVLREVLKERMGVDLRIDTVFGGAAPGGRAGRGRPGGGRPSPGGGGSPSGGFENASTPAAPRPSPDQAPGAEQPPPAPAPPPEQSAPNRGPGRQDPDPVPPPPDEPPPPPDPGPVDESEEVDPVGDADADGSELEASGMALIQRELGGQIIREIDNS
jgi:DNA polymerase-3 subunit gamma/tau